MRVNGFIIAWLIPSILIWGGCATPALFQSSPPAQEGTAGESQATDSDAEETPPSMACAEAALIRETALAKGFSPVLADQFEQAIRNAPAQDRSFLAALALAQLNGSSKEDPRSDQTRPPTTSSDRPLSADTGYLIPRTIDNRSETYEAASDVADIPHGPAIPAEESGTTPAGIGQNNSQPSPAATAPAATTPDTSSSALSMINTQTAGSTAQGGTSVSSQAHPPPPVASPVVSDGGSAAVANRPSGDAETRPPAESVPDQGDLSWQKQLRQSIARLQQDLASDSLDEIDASRLRACLSLLQLAADDPERALSTLEGMDEQQLEFWRQTVMGLGTLLNREELPKLRQRVDVAAEHLQKGISTLSTLGPLRLVNLAFCTSVLGYGDFVECDAYALEPGREVLLYVEVENFAVEEIANRSSDVENRPSTRRETSSAPRYPSYETDLHGRYEILDQQQRVIVSRTFPPNRDRSRNHRRDYFIPYSVQMPKEIAPGSYTLELTIEDKKGNKFGSAVTDFRIR